MGMDAHLDVGVLPVLELDSELQWATMVLRINLAVVGIHGEYVEESALLRGQHIYLLASTHELVQLDLGLADLTLEQVQLLL